MIQVISLLGSLLILAAFAGSQLQRLDPASLTYAALNFVGSGILAAVAALEQQWGFLLLEGVWALISLWSTVKLLRLRRIAGSGGGI